jgi:hypothetical protein
VRCAGKPKPDSIWLVRATHVGRVLHPPLRRIRHARRLYLTNENFEWLFKRLDRTRVAFFACPEKFQDIDSFCARCKNREVLSVLAIHTAAFGRVHVMLVESSALCYGKGTNLTCFINKNPLKKKKKITTKLQEQNLNNLLRVNWEI